VSAPSFTHVFGDGGAYAPEIRVRTFDDNEPQIQLAIGAYGPGVQGSGLAHLTAAEARTIAGYLTASADYLEGKR